MAIFLVDTQGLFDNDTTSGDNAKVFSLTSLLSSIQIINLSGNIREDELQYVSFAMEFAKYATPKMGKPYQNVTFLIRDWQCEEDFEFGHKGGKKYINKVLKGKSEQSKEFESIRNFLIESCEEIQCFLLPHPGKNVAGKKNFNGNWAQLDEDFREELKKTIETLLDPENIIPKKMSGRELKVDEFLPYLKQYFKFFSTKEIPRAVNLFENLIKVELNELVEKCFRIYYHNLTHLSKSIETKSNVAKFHKRINDLALTAFKNCEKMGSHDQIEIAEKSLKSKIDAAYEIWSKTKIYQLEKEEIQKQNEAKLNEIVAAFETEKKKMNDEIYSVKSSFENDKKELENKVESLKSELNTVRVTRNVNSRFDMCSLAPLLVRVAKFNVINKNWLLFFLKPSFGSVSSYPNYISNDCSSSNFYVPSYSSSSSRASSASTSNPWHAHQKSVSKVWSQMSASEKRSAGNFNTFASASYRKGK